MKNLSAEQSQAHCRSSETRAGEKVPTLVRTFTDGIFKMFPSEYYVVFGDLSQEIPFD